MLVRAITTDVEDSGEEVLTVAEAAKFANVSTGLLYDHHRQMRSALRIGRAVRFRKNGLLDDLAALGDSRDRPPRDLKRPGQHLVALPRSRRG